MTAGKICVDCGIDDQNVWMRPRHNVRLCEHCLDARNVRPVFTAAEFRARPDVVMREALSGEVVVTGDDGEQRLIITRCLEPLEPDDAS